MPKNQTQPVYPPVGPGPHIQQAHAQEPRSGSKSVKNTNHSRARHGEGS
jgi:hypothetical protein